MYVSESLTIQAANRASKLLALITNDVRAKITVRTLSIALVTQIFRQFEDDGDGEHIMLIRKID